MERKYCSEGYSNEKGQPVRVTLGINAKAQPLIPFGSKIAKILKMTKKRRPTRAARENLYTIIIAYTDSVGTNQFCKWKGILYDRPATWNKTAKDIKRLFPSVDHVNVYGGISGKLKKHIKAAEL